MSMNISPSERWRKSYCLRLRRHSSFIWARFILWEWVIVYRRIVIEIEGRKSIEDRNGGKGGNMGRCCIFGLTLIYITAVMRPINTLPALPTINPPYILFPPCVRKYYDSFDINWPLTLHIHLFSAIHPHPLLQKLAEIPNWTVLPWRSH